MTVVTVVTVPIAPGGGLRAGPVEGHRPAVAPDVQRTGTPGESTEEGDATARSVPRTSVTLEMISVHVAPPERRGFS